KRPSAAIGGVVSIRKAKVECQMVATVWVELAAAYSVKAFRRLIVAFAQLRTKLARIAADGIGGKQHKPIALFHPNLKLLLPLENPDEHRTAPREPLSGKPFVEPGKVRRAWKRPAKLSVDEALCIVNCEAEAAGAPLRAPCQGKQQQRNCGKA